MANTSNHLDGVVVHELSQHQAHHLHGNAGTTCEWDKSSGQERTRETGRSRVRGWASNRSERRILRERFKKGNWSGGAIWRARVSPGSAGMRTRRLGYWTRADAISAISGVGARPDAAGTHRASASSEARGTRSGRSPPCPPAGCPPAGPGAALPSCPRGPSFRNVHLRGFLRVTAAACCAECTIWGARQRGSLGKRRTCDDVQQLLFHDPVGLGAVASGGFSSSDSRARVGAASSLPHTRPSRAASARALDAT